MILAIYMALQQTQTLNRDLDLFARAVVAIPQSARFGEYRPGPEPVVTTRFVRMSDGINVSKSISLALRSKEIFGRVLPDFWQHSFGWHRYGSKDVSPGAYQRIAVSFLPSKEHAYLNALGQMIDGVQSTKWPRPGFPELTSKATRQLGDRVWGIRSPSETTLVAIVNQAVMRFELQSPKAGKEPRTSYDAAVIKEWDAYLAKVVEKVRASPLNK